MTEKAQYLGGGLVSVLLPLPLAGPYDYRVPVGLSLALGDFVAVPLGRRRAIGAVWGAGTGEIAKNRLKDIAARIDARPLPDVTRRFIDWVAAYTLAQPGAVLKMAMSVPDALEPPAPRLAYIAGADPSASRIKLTPARRRVLTLAVEGPPRSATELARAAACGVAVVKGLSRAALLTAVSLPDSPAPAEPNWRRAGPALSPEQHTAAAALEAAVGQSAFSVSMLDGVPGSGKTEVYFQAVAATLAQGRQVLVLLPEIALGAQWDARFRARFGVDATAWHSDLGQRERRAAWRAVAAGQARVVVGARSALFLPYPDLGLIVVDEEHDSSYKQEEGVIYNARDMAVVRARLGGFPIVLASATPSLETVTNARAGRYRTLHLPDRHAGALLPQVSVVDMRAEKLPAGRWLSQPLTNALTQVFADGEQAMLFLNRRGYAPLTLCRACGHRMQCPRCTTWLVEHRGKTSARLMCHHCGFSIPLPESCPSCRVEGRFAACGPGVERLAEEATAAFPDARLALAASDTIAGPAAAAELVRQVENRDVDLVIGTQIVAKGYHFPMLTLVGVIDADLGLAGGDLRAAERTYQLLYQVAGRAGRADRPGRVMLQTFMPEHPVMAALVSGDRERFLAAEADARRAAAMPPFGRLAALIVSSADEAAADAAARMLARNAPRDDGITVLGPAPAPIARLRGRYRRRLLLKAPRDVALQPVLRAWLATTKPPAKARIQIDVDPVSFL